MRIGLIGICLLAGCRDEEKPAGTKPTDHGPRPAGNGISDDAIVGDSGPGGDTNPTSAISGIGESRGSPLGRDLSPTPRPDSVRRPPSTNLGRAISQLEYDRSQSSLHRVNTAIKDLVNGDSHPEDSWTLQGGPQLVEVAKRYPELSVYVFKLVGALAMFGLGADVEDFCMSKATEIRRSLLDHHGTQWSLRSRRRSSGITQVFVDEAFLANADGSICSAVSSYDVQAIVLAHRLHRYKLLVGTPGASIDIVDVERDNVFKSSFRAILNPSGAVLRNGIDTVEFSDENGRGVGVVRDWYSSMALSSVREDLGLFKFRSDSFPAYRFISDTIAEEDADDKVQMFTAVGRLMGLAIVDGYGLGYEFPVMFYSKLLRKDVGLMDVVRYEPALVSACRAILAAPSVAEMGVEEIEIDGTEYLLTMENREELINRKINSLIPQESMRYLDAIRAGLVDVVPEEVLAPISPGALGRIIQGSTEIDLNALKAITDYKSPYTADHRVIQDFWAVVESFDQSMKSKLLFFLTSNHQLPIGGFPALGQRFRISQEGNVRAYPWTRTCFFTLNLPPYNRRAEHKTMLIEAIMNAQEGMFIA